MSLHEVEIPRRKNGQPKSFWYADGHVVHRDDDGTMTAWNVYGCHHHPEESADE